MDESFHQDELSAEDLAILQAFEKMDFSGWEIGEPATTGNTLRANKQPSLPPSASELPVSEDMLALYIAEAAEDMSIIRRALQQLEPDEQLDTARLQLIQRTAHKMKGSAGTIGYITISTLAHHMEELTKRILNGTVVPFVGLHVLAQSIQALETTLNGVVTYNQETTTPLNELETEYKTLDIDIYSNSSRPSSPSVHQGRVPFNTAVEDESLSTENSAKFLAGSPTSMPDVRVDMRHFEQLLQHSAQLAELHAPLENAQAEMERAMQELHGAQAHLSHVEASLASHLLLQSSLTGRPAPDERPTSSLVARILDEAAERTGHNYQRKHHSQPPSALSAPLAGQHLPWDALEIEHFTETDVLVHSLSEAIADVATASTQLRLAFACLQHITQKHVTQANSMRNDIAFLRLTSMSVLLSRIERAVTMNGIARRRQIQFEVTGETTEIDQDILEQLKLPLLQLVRTCIASDFAPEQEGQQDDRIWFHIRTVGNEITIEIGFSQPIGGGSLNEVQEAIRHLNGSITAQRNETGSISFYLRLPRSQGAVHGLLVRVEHQQVIVPFSQVLRIDSRQQYGESQPVILNTLLGFPRPAASPETVRPVLILQINPYFPRPLAVQVDEVVGAAELVVKPLAPHLRRPGITGTAIDGMGRVLLMVDVPELLRHQKLFQHQVETMAHHSPIHPTEQTQLSVLVADDSVYIRQSLVQILSHAGYRVNTARDGMEALELMLNNPPHALVLDLEMPNLNGYDLLSMMHLHPELAHVKVIMLTSHSSEKHQKHANELGISAYLTKPCPQDILLETLQRLLHDV